jgi:hypothetical protein
MERRQAAANFLEALRLGGRDYSDRCPIEPLKHEDDMEAVRKTLHSACVAFPSDDWIANVTGGTKPMSIAAYEFFMALCSR